MQNFASEYTYFVNAQAINYINSKTTYICKNGLYCNTPKQPILFIPYYIVFEFQKDQKKVKPLPITQIQSGQVDKIALESFFTPWKKVSFLFCFGGNTGPLLALLMCHETEGIKYRGFSIIRITRIKESSPIVYPIIVVYIPDNPNPNN